MLAISLHAEHHNLEGMYVPLMRKQVLHPSSTLSVCQTSHFGSKSRSRTIPGHHLESVRHSSRLPDPVHRVCGFFRSKRLSAAAVSWDVDLP